MTKDEALKLALRKAFQMGQDYWYHADHEFSSYHKKADAIRAKFNELVEETVEEALAQPEQEPVVWMYVNKSTHEVRFQKHMRDFVDHGAFSEVPLFSEPLANQLKTSGSPIPQRKPLSDEEIALIVAECASSAHRHDDFSFARAIEAAHDIKEKNA